VGILQGFTGDELRTRYPKIFAEWINGSMDFAPPDGESRRDGQIRMARIFDAIVARHDGIVAMVSHGGTIRLLLRMLFSDHQAIQDDQYTLPIHPTRVWYAPMNGAWTVHELGVTPHLSASQGREDQQRVL
jgi:broad specificity phosphatase PhoE